jgi:hypothetical protein
MAGFTDERQAAKGAIESLGYRALMAETAPASSEPSKTALLPFVDQADAVVLMLGARYGWVPRPGAASPTEEEFQHAQATNTPVLVFVQKDVEMEEAQAAFKDRVGGSWTDGVFMNFFSSPQELALQVVKALRALDADRASSDAAPAAQARAAELAVGERGSTYTSGKSVRVALVPVGSPVLIDALVLDGGAFEHTAVQIVRAHRLIPQTEGIEPKSTSKALELTSTGSRNWHNVTVVIYADGAIVANLPAHADGQMGNMAISFPRVEQAIAATAAAAQEIWNALPEGHRVRDVAVCVSIPDADNSPLSVSGNVAGNRMSMPSIHQPVVAPDPPVVLRRVDVGGTAANWRVAVSLKQIYADQGAVMA